MSMFGRLKKPVTWWAAPHRDGVVLEIHKGKPLANIVFSEPDLLDKAIDTLAELRAKRWGKR